MTTIPVELRELLKGAVALIEQYVPFPTAAGQQLRAMLSEQPQAGAGQAVPADCRQRLAAEGKPYPRSSCQVCGSFSPKWRECDAALNARPPARQEQGDEVRRLREALEWYEEKVQDCRKIGETGDNARQALDLDGGFRARDALTQSPKGEEE